jgi:pyridoxal phosphate enzyme (YggS family)
LTDFGDFGGKQNRIGKIQRQADAQPRVPTDIGVPKYPLSNFSRPGYRSRMDSTPDLESNLSSIRQRIAAACARARRAPDSVTLLAVTKAQPPDRVNEAARLGLTLFGENKVQEAKAKIPLCSGRLRWHMIGHLQSNKCRDAVELFDSIQSVDSLGLAQEINRRADQAAKTIPVLLEVNVVGEASKFGYAPDPLLAELPQLRGLPRLEIQGLFTVPPWTPDPEKSRPIFRELRLLKEQCETILSAPLPHLSMGMSGDFEIAIEEGATMVRIGTGLFGARQAARNVT